jgi:pimeloyl-ACP methyl ester carboxylesterase
MDLVKRVPAGIIREISGAGHMAFATHPEQMAAEVARFAARHCVAA